MKKSLFIGIALIVVLGICSFAFFKGSGDNVYSIETPYGVIKVKLYDETPLHRDNFIKMVKDKKYDGSMFYRVIQGFMIQGGNQASEGKDSDKATTIPSEFNPKYFHKKGALVAARQGDEVNPKKESSGTEFFIVTGKVVDIEEFKKQEIAQKLFEDPRNAALKNKMMQMYQEGKSDSLQFFQSILEQQAAEKVANGEGRKFTPEEIAAYTTIGGAPFLDGEYTVYGEVIEGMDIVDKIAAEQVDERGRPAKDIPLTIK